jgi:hypothetical protein
MNPDWNELAALLYREADRAEVELPKQLPGPRAELIQFLIHHEKRVDDLCELWALTGNWPLMLPVEWWLIQFRLWHGWELAIRLARKNANLETLPTWHRPVSLRWLLADSWLRNDTEQLAGAENPTAPASQRIFPKRPPGLHG